MNKKYLNYEYSHKQPMLKLAHAYVPFQKLDVVFHPSEALCKGTLFLDLYMPYKY